MTKHYVYVIINKINNKIYVGQTKTPNNRWSQHKSNARRGKGNNVHLYGAMIKYGFENFYMMTIEEHDNYEDINDAEDFYIQLFQSKNKDIGYNIKSGGNNHPLPEEVKQNISKALKGKFLGEKSPCYGIPRPQWVKDKSSATKLKNQRKVSPEVKQTMSLNRRGEKNAKAKLTEKNVLEIKELFLHGETNDQIAKIFDVKKAAISKIRSGRNWKHLLLEDKNV